MTLITVKTADLIGPALDWAVASIEGWKLLHDSVNYLVEHGAWLKVLGPCTTGQGKPCGYSPSTYWEQGGPLIEREGIDLHQHRDVVSSLYEYNDKRWADLTAQGKVVEIVCRPLHAGPGRGIHETKRPGKYHHMWMASYCFPSFGWRSSRDFISPTPLIAAMRCLCFAKLGNTVQVPKELLP